MKRLITSELVNTPEMKQLCDNICGELDKIAINNYGNGIDDLSAEITKNNFGDMTFKMRGIFYYTNNEDDIYDVVNKFEKYMLDKTIFNDFTDVDYTYGKNEKFNYVIFVLKAIKYDEII